MRSHRLWPDSMPTNSLHVGGKCLVGSALRTICDRPGRGPHSGPYEEDQDFPPCVELLGIHVLRFPRLSEQGTLQTSHLLNELVKFPPDHILRGSRRRLPSGH